MIQPNEGKIDRIIRIVVGVLALTVAFTQLSSGLGQVILAGLGIMMLVTGIVGYCGIYTLLGINTCKLKK